MKGLVLMRKLSLMIIFFALIIYMVGCLASSASQASGSNTTGQTVINWSVFTAIEYLFSRL